MRSIRHMYCVVDFLLLILFLARTVLLGVRHGVEVFECGQLQGSAYVNREGNKANEWTRRGIDGIAAVFCADSLNAGMQAATAACLARRVFT
jgi:hypothetical protein